MVKGWVIWSFLFGLEIFFENLVCMLFFFFGWCVSKYEGKVFGGFREF